MAKIKVTVPVLIGGKAYPVGEVVEVSDYEARLLIGVGRAVLNEEIGEALSTDPAAGDAGEDTDGKKGKRK